jgi:hypothetical protein
VAIDLVKKKLIFYFLKNMEKKKKSSKKCEKKREHRWCMGTNLVPKDAHGAEVHDGTKMKFIA